MFLLLLKFWYFYNIFLKIISFWNFFVFWELLVVWMNFVITKLKYKFRAMPLVLLTFIQKYATQKNFKISIPGKRQWKTFLSIKIELTKDLSYHFKISIKECFNINQIPCLSISSLRVCSPIGENSLHQQLLFSNFIKILVVLPPP